MRLIDGHAHLAPGAEARAALLRTMDELGIERAVVVAGGFASPREINRAALGATDGFQPGLVIDNAAVLGSCLEAEGRVADGDAGRASRLLPFFFANPWHDVETYRRTGRYYYGLKLAPGVHGVGFVSAAVRELCLKAKLLGQPVYTHALPSAGRRVADFVALAATMPDVSFILGHAGVGPFDFEAVDLIRGLANVALETSGGANAVIAYAVRELGPERVIFGSEYPLMSPRAELAKIDALGLSPRVRAAVLGGNIARLVPALAGTSHTHWATPGTPVAAGHDREVSHDAASL